MKYEYQCPTTKGYKRIKVSKAQHNSVFKYGKRTLLKSLVQKQEYYDNGNQIIVQHLPTLITKILCVVLLPVNLLFYGVGNLDELIKDTKRIIQPKKYGSFSSDVIFGEQYSKFKDKE